MKHFITAALLSCMPALLSAQNAFDKRTAKKPYSNNAFRNSVSVTDGSVHHKQVLKGISLEPANPVSREISIRKSDPKRRAIINPQHAVEMAYVFLYQTRSETVQDLDINRLKAVSSETDALGHSHIRLQQQHNGTEVFGSEILVHFNGPETYAHGIWTTVPQDFNMNAEIGESTAKGLAAASVKPEFGTAVLSAENRKLLQYDGPQLRTIILAEKGKLRLCHEVLYRPNLLERWRVRIDAHSGEVLETLNMTCSADGPRTGNSTDLNGASRTVHSYQIVNGFFMIDASRPMYNASASSLPDDPSGAIWTINAGNTYVQSFTQVTSGSAVFSNPTAVSAHYNAGFAYEYYRNTFSRNSINGSGGTIISVINVSDENGQGFDNAFWNGTFMAYGNGKNIFKPLAGSLDVAGHEMTHGVVEKSASLEYKNQSGAINESMADIFGCMMDRSDWKIGEDIMKPGVHSTGALRDMQDPHNGGSSLSDNFYQPAHMTEFYTGTGDNGGVHINSGIPNHAFYLFATAVTREKAEQVYYRALTVYLTKTSQFRDLRNAVIQACKDLYSLTEAAEAADAFDAVGIYGDPVSGGGGGPIGNNVDDLPANPGQDFIVYYDTDPFSSFTLSKATLSNSSTSGQITRNVKRKPSVVDNGAYAVYVGSDSRIYALLLDGSKTESVVSNETIWDNVAISKDGKRLAAITTDQDTSIYVYDFTLQQWKRFKLYNPTYSNVNSGGVLYADALEWDHTGTRLMYDANNLINNQGGNDYSYWDVGVLEVWDPAANSWAGGKIEKLFSSLPENVSIGNAVYSQRSPYIVAFDYIDASNNGYYVLSYNLNTNKSGTIFSGSGLGFPCFSRNDDKLIFNAFDSNNDEVVGQIPLKTDKISVNGNATVLISLAKWGVWYANGTRKLLFDKNDLLSFEFNGLNPPVKAVINGNTVSATVPGGTNRNALVASFTHSAYSTVKVGSVIQTSGVNSNNFTTSRTYTVTAQDGSTKNYTVIINESSVGIDETTDRGTVVYPNPGSGDLHILSGSETDAELTDISGRTIMKGRTADQILKLPDLKPGTYILILHHHDGRTEYIKLMRS